LKIRANDKLYGLVLVLFLLAPVMALAGTQAQIKIEQAKVAFSDQDYRKALSLLEKAVQEEPENGEAYHYAGLCQMGLDNPQAAVPLLEKAASLQPDKASPRVDLSWAALQAGEHKKALNAANDALEIEPDNERAMLNKGKALIALKRYDDAQSALSGAIDSPVYGQSALYYSGVALVQQGKTADASEFFEDAAQRDPNSDLGRKASDYVVAITGQEVAEAPAKKMYKARIRLLYQYDNNVVPVHDEDFLPEDISDMHDSRMVADVDARLYFLRQDAADAYVRYIGYGAWQSEETQLNIMYHLGELGGYYTGSLAGVKTKVGVRGNYSGSWVDEEEYSNRWRAQPEIQFDWNSDLRTRLVLEYGGETFDEPGDGDNERDNSNIKGTLYQHFFFAEGKVNTWLGYSYEQVMAEGDNYDRTINGAQAGMIASLPLDSLLTVLYKYEHRDYFDNSFDREENRNSVNVSYQIPFYKWFAFYVGAVYYNTDGNEEPLDYERWIYSAGVVANL